MNVLTDAHEMLSPFSVQRDEVAEKLNIKLQEMQMAAEPESNIGASPRVIFVGFSGGGQPSEEVASYLGNKAMLIGLDSPLAKNDMSRIKAFTFVHSSFVGSLYHVDKLPEDNTIIENESAKSPVTLMDISNHLGFFDKGGPEIDKVLNLVAKYAEKGVEIRTDELKYRYR